MKTATLKQIRELARLYADQRPGGGSTFVTDTEANTLVNLALAELYDLLVQAGGHEYYRKDSTISIVANTAAYSLPSDFYQELGVQLEWGSDDIEPVRPLSAVKDRWRFLNGESWTSWGRKAYRLLGTHTTAGGTESIEFIPTPSSTVTGRVYYVPAFADLTLDTHSFNGFNGWEKLPSLRVAIEMRSIEERSYADLERLFEKEKERIEGLADERAGTALSVTDVEGIGFSWPYHGGRVTT